jgi:hypothetical protein
LGIYQITISFYALAFTQTTAIQRIHAFGNRSSNTFIATKQARSYDFGFVVWSNLLRANGTITLGHTRT